MRFYVVGFIQISGKSKSSGADYVISRVMVLNTLESVERKGFRRDAVGRSVQEIAVSDGFSHELKTYLSANLKTGPVVEVDLVLGFSSRGEATITGFERVVGSGPVASMAKTGTDR